MGVGQTARRTGRRDRDDHPAHPLPPLHHLATADDDTLRMPLPTTDPPPHRPPPSAPAVDRPRLDANRLWTGGLATAAVAALAGLVGTLVIRVLFQYAPVGTAAAHAFTDTQRRPALPVRRRRRPGRDRRRPPAHRLHPRPAVLPRLDHRPLHRRRGRPAPARRAADGRSHRDRGGEPGDRPRDRQPGRRHRDGRAPARHPLTEPRAAPTPSGGRGAVCTCQICFDNQMVDNARRRPSVLFNRLVEEGSWQTSCPGSSQQWRTRPGATSWRGWRSGTRRSASSRPLTRSACRPCPST